jgi:4-amino-4-deoxy-L-arabinose transferase-like glycosyltransferase
MNILIGFLSICSLFIFTFEISRRWPGISKIIFTALLIRLFFLLINNYFFYLPDGDMDAISFETKAWEWSQKGFLNVFEHFRGPDAYFYSVMISIPYSLLGRSILLAQSMSIFFGICSVFLGWLIAKKIWGNEVANKAGWVIAMFPSLISYSVLTMREVYITFFLLLACYGIITWIKKKKLKITFINIF